MNVAIAGSGPSAIYALKQLLASTVPIHITIFEAGPVAGVGTPYDPRRTPVSLLANIASIELPPVVETLHAFLSRSEEPLLRAIGVDRRQLDERSFYSRVALGAYFAAQLALLQDRAKRFGHQVTILTHHRVLDIEPRDDHVSVVFQRDGAGAQTSDFNKVILATGHLIPAKAYRSYRRILVTAGPVRRRRLRAGVSPWRRLPVRRRTSHPGSVLATGPDRRGGATSVARLRRA
jgi:uncharacterized NAD(P)/FAD-binding protein YdhS